MMNVKSIKLYSILNAGTLIVLGILYLNLISACSFTISCSSFLPTLSYLSTFRGHDTFTILALTFFSILLLILFLTYHIFFDSPLSKDDQIFLKVHEVIIISLLLTTGIIDESSGIDFFPVDDVHRFVSFGLCILSCSWAYWIMLFIGKYPKNIKRHEEFVTLKNMYMVGFVFMIATILQWSFAYTTYNGLIFNHLLEGLCEWTLITISIRFTYHLSKVLNLRLEASIKIKLKD